MLEITQESIERATIKARQTKPLVKVLEFRLYSVTNKQTGASYEVRFAKLGTKKLAGCTCKANLICYHIGAAIGLHIVLAEKTQAAAI